MLRNESPHPTRRQRVRQSLGISPCKIKTKSPGCQSLQPRNLHQSADGFRKVYGKRGGSRSVLDLHSSRLMRLHEKARSSGLPDHRASLSGSATPRYSIAAPASSTVPGARPNRLEAPPPDGFPGAGAVCPHDPSCLPPEDIFCLKISSGSELSRRLKRKCKPPSRHRTTGSPERIGAAARADRFRAKTGSRGIWAGAISGHAGRILGQPGKSGMLLAPGSGRSAIAAVFPAHFTPVPVLAASAMHRDPVKGARLRSFHPKPMRRRHSRICACLHLLRRPDPRHVQTVDMTTFNG
jgi:hypothetical protein